MLRFLGGFLFTILTIVVWFGCALAFPVGLGLLFSDGNAAGGLILGGAVVVIAGYIAGVGAWLTSD